MYHADTRKDFILSLLLSIPLGLVFIFIGDPLYLGWWYYCAVLILPLLLTLPFKPRAFFLTGISFSANLCLFSYWIFCLNNNFEGLLGLFHLFSLPFWGLGWLLGVVFKTPEGQKSRAFWAGFLYPSIAFLIGQGVIYLLLSVIG